MIWLIVIPFVWMVLMTISYLLMRSDHKSKYKYLKWTVGDRLDALLLSFLTAPVIIVEKVVGKLTNKIDWDEEASW